METFGNEQQKLDRNIKENVFTRLGVTKPYTVFVCIAVIVILGVFAFSTLKMELFPNMNLPYVVIINEADGRWVQEFQERDMPVRDVTAMYSRLQEEILLAMVPNIKNIERMSLASGGSTVFLEFSHGTKVDAAVSKVSRALNRINFSGPFKNFDLSDLPDEILFEILDGLFTDEELSARLEAAFGVPIELIKKMPAEFLVGILQNMFEDLFAEVTFALPIIMEISPDMMPVYVFTSPYRATDSAEDKRFYNDIKTQLEQTHGVATVSISLPSDNNFTLMGDKDAVRISIQKESSAVTTDTVKNILATLDSIKVKTRGTNPNNYFTYKSTLDQGQFIKNSIGDVLLNLIIGGILAVIIIFLFMRSWKMTLAVGLSIPLSVVCTFVLMYFMGIGLNIVSMSGLALVVGLLVDNSVIVLENISRLRAKGLPIREAAIKGASQILNAVIAATLTTLAVFFPMFFVTGLIMEVFMDMVWVMIFALLSSLVVAIAFLPSIMSSFRIGEKRERKVRWIAAIGSFFHRIDQSISNFFKKPKAVTHKYYNKLLATCVRFRKTTCLIAVALCAGSIGLIFINGFIMMPPLNTGEFSISISMNPYYNGADNDARIAGQTKAALNYTGEYDKLLEEKISKEKEEYQAELARAIKYGYPLPVEPDWNAMTLDPEEDADLQERLERRYFNEHKGKLLSEKAHEIALGINDLIREPKVLGSNVQDIAFSYSTGGSGIMMLFAGGSTSLTVDVVLKDSTKIGTEDATQRVYAAVCEYLEGEKYYPPDNGAAGTKYYLSDVSMNASMMSIGEENVIVTLSSPNQASLKGAIEFVEAELWKKFGKSGTGDVVKSEHNFSDAVIRHTNKQITASVTLTLADKNSISKIQAQVDKEMETLITAVQMQDVLLVEDGFAAEFQDTFVQMFLALLIGLVLIYLVMVATFQSFRMPFIVLITVPLAFTGGFALLAACGLPLSIAAIVGFMILMGVITSNGIVMIDYINKARRDDGLCVRDAVIAGANVRARPILITALSTIFAMIPLAIGFGASGGMMAPLAIVSIGGLLYATFMSLLVVPAFYMIFVRDKSNKKEENTDEKNHCSQLENEQNTGANAPVLPTVRRKKS